jgi:hypothetical protein
MKLFRACLILCSLCAGALAQDSSQTDATTAQTPQPPEPPRPETLTLRLTGSFLLDNNATMSGHVEAVTLDPASGQVKFAMVSLGYPNNRTIVTPVPWPLIEHHFDARESGGMPGTYQRFRVPFDRATLSRAPRVNTEVQGRASDAAWIAASSAYFAALSSASVGNAGAASGTQVGGASGGVANPAATTAGTVADAGSAYGAPFWTGGGGGVPATIADFVQLGTNLFGTNFLATVNTNAVGTNNFANSNLVSALTNFFGTNIFAFTNGRNPDFFGTNGFALTPFGSNVFRTNRFVGTGVTNNPFGGPGSIRRLTDRGVFTNAPAPAPPPAGTETLPATGTPGAATGINVGPGLRPPPAPTPPPAGTEPIGNTVPGAPAPTPPPAGVEPVPRPGTTAPTVPSTPRR